MGPPLRILLVVNLPWDPRLGASRVFIQLAEEWTRAGHVVEKFCLTDAFPAPTNSRGLSAIRQGLFSYRAAWFIRRHAARFDVIDALLGNLPFAKRTLRFRGLLVARSVGSHRLYGEFIQMSRKRWTAEPKGRMRGRIFYTLFERHLRKSADRAVRRCDAVNLPNENELHSLQEDAHFARPAVIQPYGLSDREREQLASAAEPAPLRLQKKIVSFIGMWGLRKGAKDWAEIIRRISAEIPGVTFVFLGTMTDEQVVYGEIGAAAASRVRCVPKYDPSQLPQLLADSALGLFPSYIEGFGLAVLEQLAASIPTVAYDVPGPRQILHDLRTMLLTPVGDPIAMAERAITILKMSAAEYGSLAAECRTVSERFRWRTIAAETVEQYRHLLGQTLQSRDAGRES